MTSRLVAAGLACRRGERMVFDGVGFCVAAGGALALTGPNGAGKSTLLRLAAGLLRPAAGRIALDGGDPERSLGEQSHYLGHSDAVKPALTAAENLAFWRDWLGGGGLAAADALDALGIGALATFPAAVLSAGRRRRLALARLLAVRRPVWLLDEPTTALDADACSRLFAMLDAHRAGGGLALIATHADLPGVTDTLNLANAP